ncbi:MAG: insulinase family protein [Planctomycetota bacterium]
MRIRSTTSLLLALAVGGAVNTDAGSAEGQPLETRPDVVTGALDNGLSYMLKQHANPEGRAVLYLHISSGSLNETERQRGIAHYLEHMAFNGSENFAPGELIPFFESLGLSFGRHQNAFTSFDQTTYILNLPDAEPDTVDKALLFFSDVASGLSLLTEEIESERNVIMEEKRTRLGPQQRVQEALFKAIAPGSTFGERLPIGVEETIMGVQRPDFVEYYERFYTPSNMTLMVVADTEVESLLPMIEEHLGDGEFSPRPDDLPVGVTPYSAMRSLVVTDPELTSSQVQLINIREPMPPVTDREGMRRLLLEQLATGVFNRRLQRKLNDGELDMQSATAFASDFFGAMRISWIGSTGKAEGWREQMTQLTTEFRRALLHGFVSQEIADARASIIAGAERFAEQEPTLPASALIGSMNSQVARGDVVLSAAQQLELTAEILPTITDEEVNAKFVSLYDDEKLLVNLNAPASVDVPTESELVELARADLSVSPPAEAAAERPTVLLAELPSAGETVEIAAHEPTGIWSEWLSNGVRVHFRAMDKRQDNATITINAAGGQIFETAENRGVTSVAALAFNRPATRGLSSTNIRDLMTGKKVSVGGGSTGDSMSISVSGNPEDLEHGLQLAHLLLTEPVVEQAAVDQWKEGQRQAIEARRNQPLQQLQVMLPEMISPEGEVRLSPVPLERVEAITADEAQAWLDRVLADAPIEVSIVGDIDRERAFELVERYIGSLPTRDRISDATLDDLRLMARPSGPLSAERYIETQTPVSLAIAGSFGPDASNVRDTQLVRFATQILSTRMVKQIREELQLVYSIQALAQPSVTYPGMGLIFAAGPCAPGNEGQLAGEIDRMFAEFAENGPSGEEVEVARGQIFNRLAEDMEQPGWWSGVMSDATYRGRSLDDIAEVESAYAGYTGDEIREAFARYYTDENRMSIVVGPKQAETE